MNIPIVPLYKDVEKYQTLKKYRATHDNSSDKKSKFERFLYYMYKTIQIKNLRYIDNIHISEILYIRSASNYSTIYLKGGEKIVTSKLLKYWQNRIDDIHFIRCHNSFYVNRNHVNCIDLKENKIKLEGIDLPISRGKKTEVISFFNKAIECAI